MSTRSVVVIDPVWRVLDASVCRGLFARLREETAGYGFVGLDLEWTTRVEEADGGKTRRWVSRVATVQISTSRTSVVVKLCDLLAMCAAADAASSSSSSPGHSPLAIPSPLRPLDDRWPNHRVGVKANTAEVLRPLQEDLLDLLRDDTIFKVGVGIAGDKAKLESDYDGVELKGCVDLNALEVELFSHCSGDADSNGIIVIDGSSNSGVGGGNHCAQVPVGSRMRSLKELCQAYAGRALHKDPCVILSDWAGGLGALSPLQVQYATSDAEASFDTGLGLLQKFPHVRIPYDDDHSGVAPASVLSPLVGRELPSCRGAAKSRRAADPFRAHVGNPTAPLPPSASEANSGGGGGEEGSWVLGRTKPYYDNINVYNPEGELVFTVDRSKAEWYVYKKNLATVREWRRAGNDDPASSPPATTTTTATTREKMADTDEIASIELCFSPDFSKYNDAHIRRNLDYFKQPKQNICVICGGDHQLVRFAVIPLMYRKFFPSVYMSHNSFDLLLLCGKCFSRSRTAYHLEKLRIASDYRIPIRTCTPDELEVYGALIESLETEVPPAAMHALPEDDRVDFHVRPCLRLKVMREFYAIQMHRHVLINVLKYAKALVAHYKHDAANGKGIPQSRLEELSEYLDTHAPVYCFSCFTTATNTEKVISHASAGGCTDQACCCFSEHRPSSPEGVRTIMGIGTDAVSDHGKQTKRSKRGKCSPDEKPSMNYRAVLTKFWLRQHPELRSILPSTTRKNERERHGNQNLLPGRGHDEDSDDSDDDAGEGGEGEEEEAPYVDSHGFMVIRTLLEKYRDCGHVDATAGVTKRGAKGEEKNADHAVGQFIFRWRCLFMKEFEPKFLPAGWVPEDGILQ